MAENVRVGLIGAGANTLLRHIPGFQAIDGVDVVAVANRTEESAQRVADQHHIPTVHQHWTDVVDDLDIDAVCIGTWPYMHSTITLAALEAGKHVMTEARMAMNAAEAHQMYAASQAHPELVAQIVPSPFGLRIHQVVQDLLQERLSLIHI